MAHTRKGGMMKNTRMLAAVAAMSLLTATVAWADYNVLDKGSYYQNATSGAKTNQAGDATTDDVDRDRDFPLITNLFAGQQLTAGQTYQMNVAVPLLQYTRAAIMLTWASAAADTDSTRIFVRVYGATASTSANWHLWTPDGGTFNVADSCYTSGRVAADSGAGVGRCMQPNSFVIASPREQLLFARSGIMVPALASPVLYVGPAITGTGRVRLRVIPRGIIRFPSANGVMLNLTDNSGAPCPFPYIRIEVTNGTTCCTLTNIQADIWPRVQ